MNPQSLYELVRAEHETLVSRTERVRRSRRPLTAERRRWWHAWWRPPHAQARSVLPTVPAPLAVR